MSKRSGRLLGLMLILLLVAFLLPAAVSPAQSPQDKIKQVADEMEVVEAELQASVDEYNRVTDEMLLIEGEMSRLQLEIEQKQVELDGLSAQIEDCLYNYYAWSRNGFAQLLTGSDDLNSFYENSDRFERVLAEDYGVFKKVDKAKELLDQDVRDLASSKAQHETMLVQVEQKKVDVEAKLQDVQGRFKQALADLGVAEVPGLDWGIIAQNGSSRGMQIIACAVQQLGKPYLWAASGPDLFDCSGLTQFCTLRGAGVLVLRTADAQYNSGRKVPLEQARAGDLICFAKDGVTCHHIGIIVGDGKNFIHAPSSGQVVRIQAISSRGDIKGVVRFVED